MKSSKTSKLSASKLTQTYTGILAEPFPKWTALTQPTEGEIEALIESRMRALFSHFGLDPAAAYELGPKMAAAWADLAWHLARQHVPGFCGAPPKRGRPATRQSDDYSLVMHVDLFKRRDGLSERKAIIELAKRNVIPGSEQALRQRYKRAKKHYEPIFRLFDNVAAAKGHDVFVRILEESLTGDQKDTFLSPS